VLFLTSHPKKEVKTKVDAVTETLEQNVFERINLSSGQKAEPAPLWIPESDSSTPSIKDALSSVGRKKNLIVPEFQSADLSSSYDNGGNTSETTGLSKNDILEAWNLFLESLNPADTRMINALRNQNPSVDPENGHLTVFLRNKALVAEFKENFKPSLSAFLSEKLNHIIEVSENVLDIEDSPKAKYYTDIDKLKYMIEKNPAVAKLKQDFNLDFE